jgi:hypothetical protein
MFNSIEEAVKVAKNDSLTELEREKALQYLETSDDPESIKTLIAALEDEIMERVLLPQKCLQHKENPHSSRYLNLLLNPII